MKEKRLTTKTLTACLLGVVLVMELVFGNCLAAVAASKITLKSGAAAPNTVYAGHSYTLAVKGTSVKFYSSNKSVATIGMTTGKMKVIAPGSVKITAKSKKTGKAVASKTFTVLQRATTVKAECGEIYLSQIGDNATIKASLTPATSTDVIRFVSTDKNIAKVGSTSGKVTAVEKGKTTIKIYAKATKATSNSSKYNKVAAVDVYVGPVPANAVQTALTQIKVDFKGDIGECSFQPEDFTLVREGGTPAAIKAVEKTGAQELLLTTNEKMNDGGTYTLTYDGYSVSFEATNGLVSALSIEPKTVMVNTPTDVTVSTKDAKGIVLDTYKLGAPDLPKELAFSVKPTGGSVNAGGQLTLASLAGTAEAEAVYTAEDGTEIREKTTITAVKREVELDFEPKVIREAMTTSIHLLVKDKQTGEVLERYAYGSSIIPDYLTVTFQPTDGFAEPAAGGLCLANAGATAAVHMEYHKEDAEGSMDGTITARVATEEEKAAEKAEQERQSSSSSSSSPSVTPAPTPVPVEKKVKISISPESMPQSTEYQSFAIQVQGGPGEDGNNTYYYGNTPKPPEHIQVTITINGEGNYDSVQGIQLKSAGAKADINIKYYKKEGDEIWEGELSTTIAATSD